MKRRAVVRESSNLALHEKSFGLQCSRIDYKTWLRTWQGGGPSGWRDWRRHNPSDLSGLPRWGPSQFRLVPSHQQYCQKVDILLKAFLNVDSSPPSPVPQSPQSTTSHSAFNATHLARLYRLRLLPRYTETKSKTAKLRVLRANR
jgi:hypothetical protein